MKPKEKLWIDDETKEIKELIIHSGYSEKIKRNLIAIHSNLGADVFGNSQIVQLLNCSEVTATAYIKRLYSELQLIAPVTGHGKGKYRFFTQTSSK